MRRMRRQVLITYNRSTSEPHGIRALLLTLLKLGQSSWRAFWQARYSSHRRGHGREYA